MEYTLMHKKLPVAQIEIDEETGSISKIIEIFRVEHLLCSMWMILWKR